jgi:hypothetical protein
MLALREARRDRGPGTSWGRCQRASCTQYCATVSIQVTSIGMVVDMSAVISRLCHVSFGSESKGYLMDVMRVRVGAKPNETLHSPG